jgi:OFA family oxalate/formate antiporter-like MFS transporter
MKKHGVYTVIAAIAIQLTLGIAYIWSVFQTGVANSIFGGDNAAAGLTFSLLIAMMTVGSVIGGKLTARYSTRMVVFSGGIIMSVGFFLASFVTAGHAWLLWMTYGVMGGLGMGFSYSTTIACAQKWYPHRKGLVTGIIVSALGFGGVVFTPIVESARAIRLFT